MSIISDTSISNNSTIMTLSNNLSNINERFIQKISETLERVIKLNKSNLKKVKSIFNCGEIPGISLYNYLYRIKKYLSVEDNTLIIALIYIDKICKDCKYMINSYNIHKFLFVAIVLAIKYNEDFYYTQSFLAKIGGISTIELERLELKFAFAIEFQFYVKKSLFDKYYLAINKI